MEVEEAGMSPFLFLSPGFMLYHPLSSEQRCGDNE